MYGIPGEGETGSVDRLRLPPVITASNWATVQGALWGRSPRGLAEADGVQVPRWTSREAAAVVQGMRGIARRAGDPFALWYQFAAVALGWEPGGGLDSSDEQADLDYPADTAVQLSQEFTRIAGILDRAKVADPSISLADAWSDPKFVESVSASLQGDGAANATFKIPLPACRDPRTGKPVLPVRGRDGKWTCPGGLVTVDDPVTAIVKSLSKVAIPLALILIAYGALKATRRGRRKRK